MKRIYLDVTQWGCTGLLIKDTEIVWAGTTVYPMPVRDKENPYSKMAEEYDIHFIFDDAVPKINFYTIPRVDIMAQDSDGGYIATVGEMTDSESDAAIYYIDKDRNTFQIAANFRDFLETMSQWKLEKKPCGGIQFFSSREEAQRQYEFLEPEMIFSEERRN